MVQIWGSFLVFVCNLAGLRYKCEETNRNDSLVISKVVFSHRRMLLNTSHYSAL